MTQTPRMVLLCGVGLLAVAGFLLIAGPGWAAPASAPMQRMLISAGCYRIAGHATGAVAAYCLDQTGATPRQGTVLDETPALGEATVSVGDKTMSLKAALARRLLRIEGTDAPDQLTLVNTSDQTLSLCVGRPVVIMGNGVAYSADLRRIYDRIADLMRFEAPGADHPADEADPHGQLQQRLWALVNAADEKELANVWPLGGAPAIDRGDCAAKAAATVLCR
ncbi:MAG TPA: hypothetical protein VKQ29_15160 [Aliidongia sp.]|nr:hypothetical protein [Aliidongia sp.]